MGVQTKRSRDDSMEELFALWLVEGPSSEESCYTHASDGRAKEARKAPKMSRDDTGR